MQLSVDESGNTGLDFLNQEQPIFCLASTNIDNDTAWRLLQPLHRQEQIEVKYSTLKRTESGRQSLLKFFRSPAINSETVNLEFVHKKFAVCAQIVDKLIEPAIYDQGIDLYDRGLNNWTANLLFYTGEHTFSSELWEQFLSAFVLALRNNTNKSYDELEEALTFCCNSPQPGWERNTDLLRLAQGRCRQSLSIYENRSVFDPSIDLFQKMVQHWMRTDPGTIQINHDASKPLAKSKDYLETLMTPVAPRTVGHGERHAEFPLRISEINLVNSRDHPAVQLADIFAGAAIDCVRSIRGDREALQYHHDVSNLVLERVCTGGITPSAPDELGLNDEISGRSNLLDGVCEFMAEVKNIKNWSVPS